MIALSSLQEKAKEGRHSEKTHNKAVVINDVPREYQTSAQTP
jgi:hypothetical protein